MASARTRLHFPRDSVTNGRLLTERVTSRVWRGPQVGRYATVWARDAMGRRRSRETFFYLFSPPRRPPWQWVGGGWRWTAATAQLDAP